MGVPIPGGPPLAQSVRACCSRAETGCRLASPTGSGALLDAAPPHPSLTSRTRTQLSQLTSSAFITMIIAVTISFILALNGWLIETMSFGEGNPARADASRVRVASALLIALSFVSAGVMGAFAERIATTIANGPSTD